MTESKLTHLQSKLGARLDSASVQNLTYTFFPFFLFFFFSFSRVRGETNFIVYILFYYCKFIY